jgi:tetratricopeptide (TPR) repeat protein
MLVKLLRDVLGRRGVTARGNTAAQGGEIDVAAWLARRKAQTDSAARAQLTSDLARQVQQALDRHTAAGQGHPIGLLGGWRLLGDWRWQDGDYAGAEGAYRQALRCNPVDARTQEGLGLTLLHLHRLDEAWLHFEVAHRHDPMNAEVLTHWGLVDLERGHLTAAAERFQKAIERDPRNPHAWHNLGLAAMRLGDRDGCVAHLRRCVELKPDHGLGWSNLALALRLVEDLPGALDAARRAAELKGASNARVWAVLADVEGDAGEFDAALTHARQALSLDARHLGGHIVLGKLLTSLARHAEAEAAFRQALQIAPGDPEATGGLGQLLLLQARWHEGWPLYEARRGASYRAVRELPIRAWQGEAGLTGQRLLVHAEQGMGDIILFASCLGDLQRRSGAELSVEVPPRLARLLARSYPDMHVISHDFGDPGLAWLGEPPAFERELAAGSMPLYLRPDAASFGSGAAYLRADPARVARWRTQVVGPAAGAFVIGIAWRGGLTHTAGVQRSVELDDLLLALQPLLARADVGPGSHQRPAPRLLCLQHGEVAAEVAAAEARHGLTIHAGPAYRADFDELAAATCACDVVLSVCSTQAHLTGALGVPGMVLVPASPNWRYSCSGERLPWYGSLVANRQEHLGDWAAALARCAPWVAERIAATAAGAHAAPPTAE